MTSHDYQVITYDSRYDDQIVLLQSHLWGNDTALNADYLDWKYKRNPYVESPLIYLTLFQGKVVGMMGMVGSLWEAGQPLQSFKCLCAADLVIDPAHRKRGIFKLQWVLTLDDLAQRNFPYIFILSGHEYSSKITVLIGWRSIGGLRKMQRVHYEKDLVRAGRRRLSKIAFLSGVNLYKPFDPLDRWANGGTEDRRLTLSDTPMVEEMSDLVNRIGSDGRVRHVRDEAYFSWRYQNPLADYRFLYWREKRLMGYLVLQSSIHPIRNQTWANIVDWEATDTNVKTNLLQAAIEYGKFNDLGVWAAHLGEATQSLLTESGFRYFDTADSEVPYPTVLVRPIEEGIPDREWVLADRSLLELGNWDVRGIYSDGF
jgi:hypothetical protein